MYEEIKCASVRKHRIEYIVLKIIILTVFKRILVVAPQIYNFLKLITVKPEIPFFIGWNFVRSLHTFLSGHGPPFAKHIIVISRF